MNIAILKGRLGAKPEKRETPSGVSMTQFTLAVSDKWIDKVTGEMKERTDWFYISTFGPLADTIATHLDKGWEVMVEGKLRVNEKPDEDNPGKNKRWTAVVAAKVYFLRSPKAKKERDDEITDEVGDDEVPF